MKFDELNAHIPYAKGGKEKSLTMSPYPNITLAMPGRHANDTVPKGGDFVVMVTDPVFNLAEHQFTHTDIFKDVELSRLSSAMKSYDFMRIYLDIIHNNFDPVTLPGLSAGIGGRINPNTFLYAVQCLAVAEHRRYAQYENKFGGRYLPFRFAAGIAEGLWDAEDASNLQRKGRPGVEMLEKMKGVPILTKELMS